MKLLWTDVRATAMALFNSYSKHPERGEHDFRGWTYDHTAPAANAWSTTT